MRGNMMGTIATGVLLGAAATIMVMPQLDHKTRRRVNKMGRRMMGSMNMMYGNLMGDK